MARVTLSLVCQVVGSILAGAGVFLPWIRVNPNNPYPYVNMVYIPGMDAGIHGADYMVLVTAGFVLITSVLFRGWRLAKAATALGGGGVIAYGCYRALRPGYRWVGLDTMFVPDVGWYLTLLGGLLLFAGCGMDLFHGLKARRTRILATG